METTKEITSEIIIALETLGRAIEDYNKSSTGEKYAVVVTVKTLSADSRTPTAPIRATAHPGGLLRDVDHALDNLKTLDGDLGFNIPELPQLCCPPGTTPVIVTYGSRDYLVCQ